MNNDGSREFVNSNHETSEHPLKSAMSNCIGYSPNSEIAVEETVFTPLTASFENPSNIRDNNTGKVVVPHYLDMDDSCSSDIYYMSNQAIASTNGSILLQDDSSDLSFLSTEESLSISESHFHHLANLVDDTDFSSNCYSKNSEVPCEDLKESASEGGSTTHAEALFVQDSHLQHGITTVEESSMDSGLGSVDSAYGNSGEESISSPDVQSNPSSPEDQQTEYGSSVTGKEEFHDCLESFKSTPCSGVKRKFNDYEHLGEPAIKKTKNQKRVDFSCVTVFYFPRRQSFVTVPSQGGSTLGMGFQHIHCQTMTLQEHKLNIKKKHKRQVREHIREQAVENKIKQLKFLNPQLDNATISCLAQNQVPPADHSVDSDSDDTLLDTMDEYFFLQPLSAKKRRKLLRLSGVEHIDGEEKVINRITRKSREMCGCSCDGVCVPDSCECALAGIQCQVDRESFPCSCAASACHNENGRIEFDSDRVRLHFDGTMERLKNVTGGHSDVDVINQHMIFSWNENSSVSSADECASSNDDDQFEASSLDNVGLVGDAVQTQFDGCINSDIQNGVTLPGNFSYNDCSDRGNIAGADTTFLSSSTSITNVYEENNFPECFTNAEETPTCEFLGCLGLQKIDKDSFLSLDLGVDVTSSVIPETIVHPEGKSENSSGYLLHPTPFSSYSVPSNFPSEAEPMSTHCSYTSPDTFDSSLNTQNVYSYFNSEDIPQQNQFLYGTTSSAYSTGNSPMRDCTVLLDPIATFMNSHSSM